MAPGAMSDRHAASAAGADRGPLRVVLLIGIGMLLLELVGGIAANSLALLADAGHVLADVTGIALVLAAIHLGDRPASGRRTFGWYRAEVLVALINALLLFGLAVFLFLEAWQRLGTPSEVASGLMLAIALVGAVGNLVAIRLLHGPGQ